MTAELSDALRSYLSVRRALGFKLADTERLLTSFVADRQAAGVETITTSAALAWAQQPAAASPARWSRRLGAVRQFATYMLSLEPATEVPPTGVWPGGRRREPVVCSPAQIAELVDAAGALAPPFKADTYRTLIGLIAVTGMRRGEAIGLDVSDVDLDTGRLTIHAAKFGKSREVPLHPSTTATLGSYARLRDTTVPVAHTSSFFVTQSGSRLRGNAVDEIWAAVVHATSVRDDRGRTPRLHDLRHSFAVNTVRAWHDERLDVEARLPLLSTYLGHVNPAATYWYLTATPDLLAAAARRLEDQDRDRL